VLRAVDDARSALADRLDEAVPADLRVDPPIPHRDEFYNHEMGDRWMPSTCRSSI
jgi:hypothetical protein